MHSFFDGDILKGKMFDVAEIKPFCCGLMHELEKEIPMSKSIINSANAERDLTNVKRRLSDDRYQVKRLQARIVQYETREKALEALIKAFKV